MRAIKFVEKNKVVLIDDYSAGKVDTHVLISSIYTGISCGTETAWLSGKMPYEFPGIPGYLGVGKILDIGSKVKRTDIKVGQIVWAGQAHASIFSQIPSVIQPLPENIDLEAATFLHLAAIGLHCLHRGMAAKDQTLYVIGQGFLGQLTAQVGKCLGMNVITSDISDTRVQLSKKYTTEYAYNARNPELLKKIDSFGGVDVIINSTGAANLEDSLINLLKNNGRLVLQGMTPKVAFDYFPALIREISIIFSQDSSRDEDRQIINFLSEGKLNITPLITHRLSPEQAVEFYGKIQSSTDIILGALINWRKEDNRED